MKLAARIILLCLAAMLLITGVFSYVTIRREAEQIKQQHKKDAIELANSMRPAISEAWSHGGHQELARSLNRKAIRYSHISVRYVVMDNENEEFRPSAPAEFLRAIIQKELATVTVSAPDGTDNVHTYVPVDVNDTGRLEISRSMESTKTRTKQALWKTFALMSTIGLLSVGIIVLGGVRMIGKPLSELVEKTKRIGAGDFGGPIELPGNTELNDLGLAMNAMCLQLEGQRDAIERETESRVRAELQLQHADRLNTVGQLAAGIAHEMGTPLNVVSGRAGLIAGGKLSEEDVRKSASIIKEETDRITTIIRGLLDFARQNKPHREKTRLHEVLKHTAELVEPLALKRNTVITVADDFSQDALFVDSGQLQQVFTNLLMNATQSIEQAGIIHIVIRRENRTPPANIGGNAADYIRVDVRDDGCGMPADELNQIFEPFFTTKDVGVGTGLGLAISYGIIRDHDGWIEVTSKPGEGSCFSVFLPQPKTD